MSSEELPIPQVGQGRRGRRVRIVGRGRQGRQDGAKRSGSAKLHPNSGFSDGGSGDMLVALSELSNPGVFNFEDHVLNADARDAALFGLTTNPHPTDARYDVSSSSSFSPSPYLPTSSSSSSTFSASAAAVAVTATARPFQVPRSAKPATAQMAKRKYEIFNALNE